MKKIIMAAIAAASITLSAIAQTQTFHQVTVFGTNVYLGDDLSTPLRLRVPSGAVISGVTNATAGTSSASVIGSNLVLNVFNWSAVSPTQNVDVGTSVIYMDDNVTDVISASAKGGIYILKGNGGETYTINSSTIGSAFGQLYNGGSLTMNAQGQGFMGYIDGASVTLSSGAIGSTINGAFYGTVSSGIASDGTRQSGVVSSGGNMIIGNGSDGSEQAGFAAGSMSIGLTASTIAAGQYGYVAAGAYATNNAGGARQIFYLSSGQSVVTEGTGTGSLTIGMGTNKHAHAVLISNDSAGVSKGNGTIFATGGDYSDNYGSIANATGTPSHMTDTAGLHTNYLRYTSSTITDSADSGAPHQFTHSNVNGTNYLAYFSQRSNEWYFIEMKTSTEHGF